MSLDTLIHIPEPVSRKHNVVSFGSSPRGLEVAFLSHDALDALDFLTDKGIKILPHFTDTDSMNHALREYQKALKTAFGENITREILFLREGRPSEDSFVRILDSILRQAIVSNASNVYMEETEREFLIRYRVNGVLHDALILPSVAAKGITNRVRRFAGVVSEGHPLEEGHFSVDTDAEKISFRVSIVPTVHGTRVSLRLMRSPVSGFTLEGLGFHGANLEHTHAALEESSGIILAAGPKKSGKTTALYTILDMLNVPHKSIATIEDSIESVLPRVSQMRTRPDLGFSFAEGLRNAMRENHDIVMVGVIPDAQTVSLMLSSSERGRLLLSSVESPSAAHAVSVLTQLGVEPSALSNNVKLIVGQQLVKRLPAQKERYTLSLEELAGLRRVADLDKVLRMLKDERQIPSSVEWSSVSFFHPRSSPIDGPTFIGLQEIIPMTKTIAGLIRDGASAHRIEEASRTDGLPTLLEDGIFKAAAGLVALEDVIHTLSRR